jgi:repressor LexA
MPSYGEIMELVGFRSRHAVYCLVERLVAAGLVYKDAQGKFSPTQHADGIPLLGVIEAGFSSPAEEELVDTMSLDAYLMAETRRVHGDLWEGLTPVSW